MKRRNTIGAAITAAMGLIGYSQPNADGNSATSQRKPVMRKHDGPGGIVGANRGRE